MNFNATYWYQISSRQWKRADYTPTARDEIRRMGYVAVNGHTAIGPPDDAPSRLELLEVVSR